MFRQQILGNKGDNNSNTSRKLDWSSFKSGSHHLIIGEKGFGKTTFFKSVIYCLNGNSFAPIDGDPVYSYDKIGHSDKDGTEEIKKHRGFYSFPGFGENYDYLQFLNDIANFDTIDSFICFMPSTPRKTDLVKTIMRIVDLTNKQAPIIFVFNRTPEDRHLRDSFSNMFSSYNVHGSIFFQRINFETTDKDEEIVKKFADTNYDMLHRFLEIARSLQPVQVELAGAKAEKIRNLEKNVADLKQDVSKALDKIAELERIQRESNLKLENKEKEIELLKVRCEEKTKSEDNLTALLKTIQKELGAAQKEKQELERKKNDLLNTQTNLESSIRTLNLSLEKHMKKLKDVDNIYIENERVLSRFKDDFQSALKKAVEDYKSYVRIGAIPIVGTVQFFFRDYTDLDVKISRDNERDLSIFIILLNNTNYVLKFPVNSS